MDEPVQPPAAPVNVQPWPSEDFLLILSILCSLLIWALAVVTIIGVICGVALVIAFFVARLLFIARVRGSGVRVGPDQFPELHEAVQRIARSFSLKAAPEVYVMRAHGLRDAFATRFLRSNVIVLSPDLLEACGGETGARDMILGRELGRLRAGHGRLRWLVLPAWLVPFLGPALSRAREYTADRYGLAACGDPVAARLGLAILAAGGTYGRRIDGEAFLRQRAQLSTGWMTLATWLSARPPLTKRLAACTPSAPPLSAAARGGLRASGILGAGVTALVAGAVVLGFLLVAVVNDLSSTDAADDAEACEAPPNPAVAVPAAHEQMTQLAAFVEKQRAAGFDIPWDSVELLDRWSVSHPGLKPPKDPFDGSDYGYTRNGSDYIIWSVGPDGDGYTTDDLVFDSRIGRVRNRRDPVRVGGRNR